MKIILLVTLLLLSAPIVAQTTAIRGSVVNAARQPLSFATVLLRSAADSTLVKTAVAGERGDFSLVGLSSGRYRVSLSSVGYENWTSEVLSVAEGESISLPSLVLAEASQTLKAVSVRATKPLIDVQPDKLVLNVEGSLTAAGSSALELLQKAPSLQVDPNDNISLQGKAGVRVYIDGKLSPLGPADLAVYLRSLQASSIEAVEIITQPSARFDAQGSAGIINIRLKKNQSLGTNGNTTLGFAMGAFYPKYNGSLSVNHRTRKVNLFATYSQRNARDWSFIQLYRRQNGQFFDQRSETNARSVAHNARIGSDWFINSRNTLGILLDGTGNEGTYQTLGRTPIGPLGSAPVLLLRVNNQSQRYRINGNLNLNYRYLDTLGHELTVDLDQGRFLASGDNRQPNQYRNPVTEEVLSVKDYRMTTRTAIALRTLKIDYGQRLWGGKVSAGFKHSSVQTDNDFNFFDVVNSRDVLNDTRSNRFVYTERITAIYTAFEKTRGKWQSQLGLRIEATQSNGRLASTALQTDAEVARQYVNAFPSAGLTYNYNPKHTFSLTYSRRIDRPTYQSLNPFESKLDELTYQKGNPFLRPQYTQTVQGTHTFQNKLTTSLSYSDTQDFFTEITDTTEVNRNFITTRNLASQRVLSLNINYPFQLAKWWNVYLNVSGYRATNRANFGAGKMIGLTANVLSVYAQQTINLPGAWRLEVVGYYTSPSVWGGTFVNRRYWGSSIGLQRKVLADRGNLVLTLADPFNSQRWRGISQFGGLYMDASGGYESRQARVNFTYSFGSRQIKAARQRKTGLEDESKRL